MRDYVIPASEALKLASQNAYRAHPSPKRSPERILPFATPAMRSQFTLSGSLDFAVFGDCFARSIENSFRKTDFNVISSQINRGMPGNDSQQIARFDIFNLEIMLQELRILVGESKVPFDAPLVDVGDETLDLMIGANFGHSRDLAVQYRQIRNSDYEAALDADVVFLVTGGVEQWFDRETELYANGLMIAPVVAAYPQRFELHRISVDHAVNVLQQIIDLVCRHSRRSPKFILTNSSASDAMTYIPNDILAEHIYSRSVQRVAVENVAFANKNCAYMPALETLFLSDRAYCYQKHNLSHTTQYFCDRIVAEMMRACGITEPAQEALRVCGIAGPFVFSERYEEARDLIHELFLRIPPDGNYNIDIFTVLLNEVYTKLRMHDERVRLHLRNSDVGLRDGERTFDPDKSYALALYSARTSSDPDVIREVLDERKDRPLTDELEAVFRDVQIRLTRISPE